MPSKLVYYFSALYETLRRYNPELLKKNCARHIFFGQDALRRPEFTYVSVN